MEESTKCPGRTERGQQILETASKVIMSWIFFRRIEDSQTINTNCLNERQGGEGIALC